jgi:hypothetical protein
MAVETTSSLVHWAGLNADVSQINTTAAVQPLSKARPRRRRHLG